MSLISTEVGTRKSILLKLIIKFLFYMGFPYIGLFLYFDLYKSAGTMASLYGVLALVFVFNKKGYEKYAKLLVILGVSLILLAYSILLGEETGAPLIFFPIISLPLIFFESDEKKEIFIGCLIPLVCRYFFDIATRFFPGLFDFYHESISGSSQFIIHEFAVFTAFLFTFVFILFFYSYQKKYYTVQQEKKFQDKEFEIARDIQEKLLPKLPPYINSLGIQVASKPAFLVTGDFYEFVKVNDSCMDIIIADIVGKGLQACLHMVAFKSILSNVYRRDLSPKELMKSLNKSIFHDPVFKKYLPVIICRIDVEKNKLIYCNAGHETSLIKIGNEFMELSSTGLVLGIEEDESYSQTELSFNKGDKCLLYTDGLPESKNHLGESFITKLNTLKGLSSDSAGRIMQRVMSFCEGRLRDDLTIVTISHL